ncbi:MAG TPA: tetratricopeptide repeat protein [Steroidobacteraceae bacterium]|nr:tetratricopeptide repeat protein [Steroidobacteraceae bacterium]
MRPSAFVLLMLGAAAAAAAAGAAPPATIGDLTRRSSGDQVQPDSAQADTAEAMDSYRRFLQLQKSDPQLRAEALRRLGDLSQDAGGDVDTAGDAEAIRLYTLLLKAYPDYPRNDQVLYQLAHAYEGAAQPEQALATLDELVRRYPTTPMLAEVQFRRGELLFSARNYRAAGDAYTAVVQGGTGSGFYQQALYKQGWSLFKQSLNEECLASFGGVLDHALLIRPGGPAQPLEQVSRAARELVEDTLRVMSITFSYMDGPRSVDAFVKAHGNPAYAWLLYSRLGDLYVDKQRYQDAAAAYDAFVQRLPDDEHAPELAMRAIEAYRKGGFADLVIQGKRDYLTHYDFAAPFWHGRPRSQYPQVVAELKTNLDDVATYYHAAAQKSGKAEDYQEAIRWYRSYLADFPGEPDSAAHDYHLADALFESQRYQEAAVEYGHTAYDYPADDRSATAGYAQLAAFQKAEAAASGPEKAALHKVAVMAGVQFARTFPHHPDSAGVLTRAAEDLYAGHELPQAIDAAQLLLGRHPPPDAAMQRIGWTVVAQSQYDQGNFAPAEEAFEHARALATDAAMRADLTERLAAAVYKQGDAKRRAGNGAGAVEDFLRVATVAPDSKIRVTAQYDAAAQLIDLGQWERAIPVLTDFRSRFPASTLQEDVTRKLAVAYDKAHHPAEAAAEFERIADDAAEQRDIRHEAITRAADLYEQAGNLGQAAAMLTQFVQQYPTPVPDAIEARARLVKLVGRQGDVARQMQLYRDIVQADAQAGAARTDRTRYLAAVSQLALAAPERDAFRAIHLVAPLKRSLAAKRKALERALAAYEAATDYHVAAVTTAATFETAELYRTLSKDVLESERPRNLSQDELEQYESLLEDQAFPFEEQAIAIHELNTARARDGVYDEWVKKSYAALAQLSPGRYGKTEATQDVVTKLQ